MKVVIVGGVAGGASCAARLRRLDEKAEILMVERGPYVSYANCGLPYHISGVIEKESSLLVASEQMFRGFFGIDARTNCEAISISPKQQDRGAAQCRDRRGDDRVVRQAGALARSGLGASAAARASTCPESSRCGRCRTCGRSASGSSAARSFLDGMYNYSGIQFVKPTRRAVVIGGGFIGLETAENLIHAGFEVTLVEMLDQVLAPLDREFARLVEEHLSSGTACGSRSATAWPGSAQLDGGALEVRTKSGKAYPADIVILALGVRPDTALAKSAGLAHRRARGHPRRRAHAHERPGHLRRRRCRRGQGLRDRPVEPRGAGRAGQPAGPHRGRRDRRARFPFSRHAGHVDHRLVRRLPRPGPASARRRSRSSATRTTRRSTCSRIRTPATTRAPSRSR